MAKDFSTWTAPCFCEKIEHIVTRCTNLTAELMANAEKYLRPDVIRQVARLDLRAKFIVEGFLTGLHASPFHGFSVEFSEHRQYVPGHDLKDPDWNIFAKTDKYYLKKFQ